MNTKPHKTTIPSIARRSVPVLALAMVCAQAHGAWVIEPNAEFRSAAEDNPSLQSEGNEDSGVITTTTVQASVRNITEVSQTAAVVGLSYQSYTGLENIDDQDDQFLDLAYRRTTERGGFAMQVNARRDALYRSTRPINNPFAGDVETEVDEDLGDVVADDDVDARTVEVQLDRTVVRATPSVSFRLNPRTNATLSYQYYQVLYSDEDQAASIGAQETKSQAVSGALNRQLSERTSLLLNVGASKFDPEFNEESKTYTATVGISRQLTERTSLSLSAGANRVDVDNGNEDTGFSTDITLNRRLNNGTLRASIGRSIYPSSFGAVVESDRLTVLYRQRMSQRLAASLRVRAFSTTNDNDDFSLNNRDYVQLTPEITWAMTENWQVAGGYQYEYQDRDVNENDAENHAVFLSLRYQPISEYR